MSTWTLNVWDPIKSAQKAQYTQAAPGGILDGFTAEVDGAGSGIQMRWYAIPSDVDIAPRDIVQLIVDGTPVFYGVVSQAWPSFDGARREYLARGGAELLRWRYPDPAAYSDKAEVIVSTLLSQYIHPALTVGTVSNALVVDVRVPGGVPLSEILDQLAAATGSRWGVNAAGEAFFYQPSGQHSFDYILDELAGLPIEGDVITQVRVFGGYHNVADDLVLEDVQGGWSTGTQAVTPGKHPLVDVAYTAPEHAQYGSEGAYAVGATAMLYDDTVPADIIQALYDADSWDPAEFFTSGGPGLCSIVMGPYSSLGLAYNEMRLTLGVASSYTTLYAMAGIKDPPGAWITSWDVTIKAPVVGAASGDITSYALNGRYYDPETLTAADVATQSVASPNPSATYQARQHARQGPVFDEALLYVYLNTSTAPSCSDITKWYLTAAWRAWGYFIPQLRELGRNLVVLPQQLPSVLTRAGVLLEPRPYALITNTPNGDVTLPVARYEYRYSSDGMSTRVQIEQRDADPVARAITWLTRRKELDAVTKSIEVLRRS